MRAALDEDLPPTGRVTLSALASLWDLAGAYPGSRLANLRSKEARVAVRRFVETYSRPSLSWEDLAFLRERTRLPILLKGVLHPADAAAAVEHGMDGIVVSNHGGRQVDGSVGTMDALPGIVEVVAGRIPVLLDSGIRSGADVFRALALGATAVGLGRPYVWGLAAAGRKACARSSGTCGRTSTSPWASRAAARSRRSAGTRSSSRREQPRAYAERFALAREPRPVGRVRRHGRRGRTEARADRRLARHPLARPAARRVHGLPRGSAARALREAGGCAISILAAGQEWLAQHFARGAPPIAMWHGVSTVEEAAGAPLLVGAAGWLECALERELEVGTHTLFVCGVRRVEPGTDAPALVRVRGEYLAV